VEVTILYRIALAPQPIFQRPDAVTFQFMVELPPGYSGFPLTDLSKLTGRESGGASTTGAV
jgi:hypothetical protein